MWYALLIPGDDGLSQSMDSLIRGLLEPDPQKRLGAGSVEEIKDHIFFEGVDWHAEFPLNPPFVPVSFNKEKVDMSSKTDMCAFLDTHFGDTIKYMGSSLKHKVHKLNQNHFEFLRYDLLHAMNKESASTIIKSMSKLSSLKSNLIERLACVCPSNTVAGICSSQ